MQIDLCAHSWLGRTGTASQHCRKFKDRSSDWWEPVQPLQALLDSCKASTDPGLCVLFVLYASLVPQRRESKTAGSVHIYIFICMYICIYVYIHATPPDTPTVFMISPQNHCRGAACRPGILSKTSNIYLKKSRSLKRSPTTLGIFSVPWILWISHS